MVMKLMNCVERDASTRKQAKSEMMICTIDTKWCVSVTIVSKI